MASIFSRIASGEIPAYIVAEDQSHLAFLDINPLAKGHTLVVPKREEDYFFDLTDQEIATTMQFAKRVAQAIKLSVPCLRVGVSVVGLEVPHAHIHLIPLNKSSDLNFSNPKLTLSKDEFLALAETIKKAFK